MRIALIGYGKMGRRVEEIALERGFEIAAVVDPLLAGTASRAGTVSRAGTRIEKSIAESSVLAAVGGVDAAIDFSRPDAAFDSIRELSRRRIPLVCGTTNWYDRMDEARAIIEADGSSLLYAPNFSIGVNMFYRVAVYAARLADRFPEYDAGGFEVHHNEKVDSPSGTAKVLAEKVIAEMTRKKKPVWDTLDRKIAPDEFHFPSLRVGAAPGTHTLMFDSAADTIEITHAARNRDGFASGAVRCAEWLARETPDGGRRRGVFTIDDFLDDALFRV
jgi:4-hydroxy-tetrahydrodipicolinate reductase